MTLFAFPAGSVTPYASPYATFPKGWIKCDGALYDGTLETFSTLFTVIGTTYGGSGTSFRVPNLGQRVIYTQSTGAFGGASTHALTPAQSGAGWHYHSGSNGSHAGHNMSEKNHDHQVYYTAPDINNKSTNGQLGLLDGANDDAGFVSTAYSGLGGTNTSYNSPSTDSAVCPNFDPANNIYQSGDSTATANGAGHENRMPFVVMQYLIKL